VEAITEIIIGGLCHDPCSMSVLFNTLSGVGIKVQSIVQNRREMGSRSDLIISVPVAHAGSALAVLRAHQTDLDFEGLKHKRHAGKVSLTGLGMRSTPEVFSTFVGALSRAGVTFDLIEISETSLQAVIEARQLDAATQAVASAFGLTPHREEPAAPRKLRLTHSLAGQLVPVDDQDLAASSVPPKDLRLPALRRSS
jgi:aspartate kinase